MFGLGLAMTLREGDQVSIAPQCCDCDNAAVDENSASFSSVIRA
jgi:hypothetical protein